MNNKRGFLQVIPFLNPWVLGGALLLIGLLFLMTLFALGKILGVFIVTIGLILGMRGLNWWQVLLIILVGVFVFINPLEWAAMSMVI